ncbi:unnamed protein product [Parnassius apollo]|uniref:(apollo) hypothetical protein n=1 Tax=Parnassius apollo TaxID=110799 RepID=A0A8S3WEJ1_PARAO|nr:unnamed protein product [Parnassius apollo]
MVIPVDIINFASDTVGNQFKEHYKTIIGLLSAIFIFPWLYNSIPRSLCCIFWQITNFIGVSTTLLINLCSSYTTLTFALAYIISVYILWSPERSDIFRATSYFLWLIIASYLASLCGSYQVYMFVMLQIIGLTGFILEVLHIHKQLLVKDPETSVLVALHRVITNGNQTAVITKEEETKSDKTEVSDTIPEERSDKESTSDKDSTPDKESPVTPDANTKRGSWTGNESSQSSPRHAKMLFKTRTLSALPLSNVKTKPPIENRILASYKQRSLDENYMRNNFNNDDESAIYFKLLFFACFCMLVWKHIWLLPVMVFFLAIHFIKWMLNFFGVWLFFENYYNNVMAKVKGWWGDRKSALVPAHIRGVSKMLSICNSSVTEMAYDSVDTVSSCIVIIGLIFFVTVAVVFVCIQIYSEAIVVIQLSGSLLNSTFVQHSPLQTYLPEGWEDKLDSLIDDAYTYGREGISTAVRSILKEGDPDKIGRVEEQILEIWDRVYQSWVSLHFPGNSGPQVDSSAVQDSWDNFVTNVSHTPGLFDYTGIVTWVYANVGTLGAIASSAWAPLASNASLLAGSFGAVTSLLLCGGGAIINMFINLVVFFTTLFYLLASSNALYKPVEVLTRVQASFGPRLGLALSVAINQVFRASFKMALFYGLWTWLVHNLFGAKVVYLPSAVAVRIAFTNCQQSEWNCNNNIPSNVVYNCSSIGNNDFIIHLKDYYTEHLVSLTVQNCKNLRVVIDCPILQKSSRLQQFKVKNCDRLEFITFATNSLVQVPPEVTIESVNEITHLPKNFFKSPSTSTESKCFGAAAPRKFRIINSKIKSIHTKAIYNVTGVKSIEFDNVTITNIQTQAIEAILGNDNSVFMINNCTIDNLESKSITVSSRSTIFSNNVFNDIVANSINVTSEFLNINHNRFKEIKANGLMFNAVKTDFTDNYINMLRSNAFINVKCLRKRTNKKHFKFINNRIENLEPYSLNFDYQSCRSIGSLVMYQENKLDCRCRNIAFLTSSLKNELYRLILNSSNSNTCISAPCVLPIDIVKLLLDSAMCQINLDVQVMCLLYNDRHTTNNDIIVDEDVTEPAPTFYLIRQANPLKGDVSAAMTAIDKEDLLKDSHLNMTNRTIVKVVFDSSRDFVETLRILAAILGAAPFLGPYLAGIPAALDVWLQGRPMAALLLPIAQAAPIAFLDAAVYAEIKDGGHPYVTGLAIAGGIFYLGPEGAILGPLLLCCLMVILNLSSSFLRDTPSEERAALHSRVRLGAYL